MTRNGRETVYQVGSALFRVGYGDLTATPADVLVSSDDNYLTMGGGISMAIKRAGGSEVAAHAQKLIPLRQGDVAVTTAGRLKAHYVFHAVTIDVDKHTYPDAACIDKLSRRSLELADTLRVRTMAYPALGTGVGGFPFEAAAEVMTRAIAEHLAEPTTVQEASIVLWARRGVNEGDLELFYERAVGLAALSSQSKRLAGAVERLREVGADAGMPELIAKLDELVQALGQEGRVLDASPRSREEIDDIEQRSNLAKIGNRAVELTHEESGHRWSDQRVEAQALQTRLEGLGTQLNVHMASLNKLEIQKAKYGGLGAPVALEHQIDEVNADIERVNKTMNDLRQRLAPLDPAA